MDMNLSKPQEIVEDKGAWYVTVHEFAESDMTERLNWTELSLPKVTLINLKFALSLGTVFTQNLIFSHTDHKAQVYV